LNPDTHVMEVEQIDTLVVKNIKITKDFNNWIEIQEVINNLSDRIYLTKK